MSETRLWKSTGFVSDDAWRVIADDESVESSETNARLILPLDRYLDLPQEHRRPERAGVLLAPADDVARLEPHLANIALIAVTFPAFSDGRAYSQASLLRARYSFEGEIRATGDVLIDQVPLMLRCGIDSFAVSNPTALKRLGEDRLPGIDSYYQPATKPARQTGGYSWRHAS
ncbi:MAG: DUF934 domain-containing protein [Alphaproteobacteria bacterium]|nr:DUF934 domain-containing protein [Alphaproteobacteria bacterium]